MLCRGESTVDGSTRVNEQLHSGGDGVTLASHVECIINQPFVLVFFAGFAKATIPTTLIME